jgi:mannose-6-phosphate isomerase-like protein (cupin superfamily)
MNAYELSELTRKHAETGNLYLEFLRETSLSMGLYRLPAGGADPQSAHTEDEVYYVLGGQALINVNGEDRPVQSGSIIFVAANLPHKFHSIEQNLDLLVFFAPAEYTQK